MGIKVFFLINSLTQGGAERIALKLNNEINNHCFDVSLVTISNDDFYNEKLNNKIVLNDSIHIGKIKKLTSLYTFFKGSTAPVLCFSLDLACYMVMLKMLGILKSPIICRFINNPDSELRSGILSELKKITMFYLLKKCDQIICQSEQMKKILKEKYKINESSLTRIYNPISSPADNDVFEKESSDEKIKLLFVGRLEHQKNLEDIIAIALILKQQGIDFTWKIVGQGAEFQKIKTLIDINNLENEIVFCGLQNDINRFYKWADVTTLTSHFEGLPNVLLESIANKTPCISYDCPTGPSEIIIDGVNGILVPLYNTKVFAEAIIKLKKMDIKDCPINNSIIDFKDSIIKEQYVNLISRYTNNA
ncbi:glycosyltransferase [Kluyvera chengduensis]|uniref:glycosyltransferase n=1 Tax=Kluyvera sp. 142359 TaxID=3375726 RepID=UPI0037744588